MRLAAHPCVRVKGRAAGFGGGGPRQRLRSGGAAARSHGGQRAALSAAPRSRRFAGCGPGLRHLRCKIHDSQLIANFSAFDFLLVICLMTDFAAIDFETANGRRTSVCSVGIVVVRGGVVVDSFYSLVRPRPNYYSEFTTAVHGLTYHDTIEAPDFAEVWPGSKGCRSWPTTRPSTRAACAPCSNFTAFRGRGMRSTVRAGPRAASSGGRCPTISCTPSLPPAASICGTTTMRWPTPKPAPGSPCVFSDCGISLFSDCVRGAAAGAACGADGYLRAGDALRGRSIGAVRAVKALNGMIEKEHDPP